MTSKALPLEGMGHLGHPPIFPTGSARICGAHIFIPSSLLPLHFTLPPPGHLSRPSMPWRLAHAYRHAHRNFAAVQMIDLHIPTTDGRELRLTRYKITNNLTAPDLALLLDKLNSSCPPNRSPHQRRSDRPAIPTCMKTFEGPLESGSITLSFATSPIGPDRQRGPFLALLP